MTRDRLYGEASVEGHKFLIVDTGGLDPDVDQLSNLVSEQVDHVLEECTAVLFMMDARAGLTTADREIAERLRQVSVPVLPLVNKSEGLREDMAIADFHELGLGVPVAVSAIRGQGLKDAIVRVLDDHPYVDLAAQLDESMPRVAVVGRPNVGKSTLINALAGENRVIVSDIPGTTRDSVDVTIERDDKHYLFVDTAGVRRRSRVKEGLEKLSVVKTLQALDKSNIAILVLDAHEGVLDQDATVAGLVEQSGRSTVVLLNKWDGLDRSQRNHIRREFERKLPFLKDFEFVPTSGLHGSGLGDVMAAVDKAFESAMIDFGTSELNRRLGQAVELQAPPMFRGKPVRLKFCHQGGRNPPTVIVHGNQTARVPESYRRYLSNFFSRSYKLYGTRVKILFRSKESPYG